MHDISLKPGCRAPPDTVIAATRREALSGRDNVSNTRLHIETWHSSLYHRQVVLHVAFVVEAAVPVEVHIVEYDAENANRSAVLQLDGNFCCADALLSKLRDGITGRTREEPLELCLRQAKDFVLRIHQDEPE